jgi:hypothetical protein
MDPNECLAALREQLQEHGHERWGSTYASVVAAQVE